MVLLHVSPQRVRMSWTICTEHIIILLTKFCEHVDVKNPKWNFSYRKLTYKKKANYLLAQKKFIVPPRQAYHPKLCIFGPFTFGETEKEGWKFHIWKYRWIRIFKLSKFQRNKKKPFLTVKSNSYKVVSKLHIHIFN